MIVRHPGKKKNAVPARRHHDLEAAQLQAASTGLPVVWEPWSTTGPWNPTGKRWWSKFGKEGDYLLISPDGRCRRLCLWSTDHRRWVRHHCAPFDPASPTALNPSLHHDRQTAA